MLTDSPRVLRVFAIPCQHEPLQHQRLTSKPSAFQAEYEGSIPFTRSNKINGLGLRRFLC